MSQQTEAVKALIERHKHSMDCLHIEIEQLTQQLADAMLSGANTHDIQVLLNSKRESLTLAGQVLPLLENQLPAAMKADSLESYRHMLEMRQDVLMKLREVESQVAAIEVQLKPLEKARHELRVQVDGIGSNISHEEYRLRREFNIAPDELKLLRHGVLSERDTSE